MEIKKRKKMTQSLEMRGGRGGGGRERKRLEEKRTEVKEKILGGSGFPGQSVWIKKKTTIGIHAADIPRQIIIPSIMLCSPKSMISQSMVLWPITVNLGKVKVGLSCNGYLCQCRMTFSLL